MIYQSFYFFVAHHNFLNTHCLMISLVKYYKVYHETYLSQGVIIDFCESIIKTQFRETSLWRCGRHNPFKKKKWNYCYINYQKNVPQSLFASVHIYIYIYIINILRLLNKFVVNKISHLSSYYYYLSVPQKKLKRLDTYTVLIWTPENRNTNYSKNINPTLYRYTYCK